MIAQFDRCNIARTAADECVALQSVPDQLVYYACQCAVFFFQQGLQP